jgi:hypothetical protein
LAAEGVQVVLGQDGLDRLCLFWGQVGVLVELSLEPLDFLEVLDERSAGVVPPCPPPCRRRSSSIPSSGCPSSAWSFARKKCSKTSSWP